LNALAVRHGINAKTVTKWRKREFTHDSPTGPKESRSSVLTDNGAKFCIQPRYRNGLTARYIRHMFDLCCDRHGIEHRLTKPKHPWTNGQVERMNCTIKDATVKRYHYDSHDQLKAHLQTFLMAYNFARRLKTLKGLTPHEYICKIWTKEPERFTINPAQHTV
jgi:transposase InsO family protein